MKKLLTISLILISMSCFAYRYKNADFFKNKSVVGLSSVTSIVEPYNEMSFDWKAVTSASTASGTFTVYGSDDTVTDPSDITRWYQITKDVGGSTITMAATGTSTTASGYVDLGRVNFRWVKLSFVVDSGSSTTAENAVINASYMTKGW